MKLATPVVWSDRCRLHDPGGEIFVGLNVTATGLVRAGRLLGDLRLPTVLVQEGGYDLKSLGQLVREVLLGVEEEL